MNHKLTGTDLCLFRGERCLFRNQNFALNPGEALALQGANGSGKTSLLRAIAGLIDFEEGQVAWDGTPVSSDWQGFRSRFVWYGHRTGFKQDLTPLENLAFEAALRPQRPGDASAALDQVGLSRQRQLFVRQMSAGQQRRAALARLLSADAPLWLMDEPFTNLDAAGRTLVESTLNRHLGRGGMAVIATHQDLTLEVGNQVLTL